MSNFSTVPGILQRTISDFLLPVAAVTDGDRALKNNNNLGQAKFVDRTRV